MKALFTCYLISLDKIPGVCPIVVGEILWRTTGKIVIAAACNEVIISVGSLQVCAGHDAGSESLAHAMLSLYNEEKWK